MTPDYEKRWSPAFMMRWMDFFFLIRNSSLMMKTSPKKKQKKKEKGKTLHRHTSALHRTSDSIQVPPYLTHKVGTRPSIVLHGGILFFFHFISFFITGSMKQ